MIENEQTTPHIVTSLDGRQDDSVPGQVAFLDPMPVFSGVSRVREPSCGFLL